MVYGIYHMAINMIHMENLQNKILVSLIKKKKTARRKRERRRRERKKEKKGEKEEKGGSFNDFTLRKKKQIS